MEFQVETGRIFAADGEKLLCEVTFPVRDGVATIDHTFVDDSLRGQGIAGQLMEAAVAEIGKNGWKAHPTCSYAVKWFEKHPEAGGLLK
ncbi:MAG: GNAT family N-acetyltransferase [Clostridia bacterium]|nr:GNAT family N-acetyltransferase [Clostridia bacterium]